MSAKTANPPNDPDHDPVVRLQVTVPRWLFWMLAGAAISRLNDLGSVLHALGQVLL